MPRVVPEYREEARKRIIENALRVFSERGYANSTMDDIARSVGVSKGALYLYFDGKEELYKALCGASVSTMVRDLRACFEGRTILDGAEAYFDFYMDKMTDRAGFRFEMISEAARDPTVRSVLEGTLEAAIEAVREFLEEKKIQGMIREDVDVRALAASFVALYEGMLELLIAGMRRDTLKQQWIGFIRTILPEILTTGVI